MVKWCRQRDLAVAYGVVVAGVATFLHDKDGHVQHRIILETSTNLANLRSYPIFVLFVSAFVVPSLIGLWVLAPLVLIFGAVQRWLGRIPLIVIATVGHVLATLFVAVLIAAGLAHGQLASSIVHEPDVGVSYAFATVAGFAIVMLPFKWRPAYGSGLFLLYTVPLLFTPNFTDVGHITALATGVGFAIVARRAAVRPRPTERPA